MNTKRTLIASAALLLCVAAQADDTAAPAEQTLFNIQVSGIRKQTNINYTVPTSRAATGMDLTLRETPQSLSVMTEKQISDQGVESLQDALNQMAGVYHSKMGNNATGDSQFASRGMPIDTFNIDGAQKFYYTSQAIRRSTNNLDSGLYEQISVVRGASGLSNGGLGEASGSIFLSRKKPTAQPFATVEAEIGSWKHTRLMLDANQPLNADKTLRGRAVLISDHGGDYLPHSHRHNHTFYGILAYDFSPNIRVNIGTELHHNRSRGSSRFGFMTIGSDWDNDLHRPFPDNAKSNSSARWAYSRENDGELFADVQHDFANGWQARAHYSYGFGHLKQLAGVAGASEDTLMYDYSGSLQADFTDIVPRSHNLTLNLDGQYALFGRKHDFNIGASANINKDTTRYYTEAYVPIDDMLAFNGNIRQPELRPDRNGDNKGHERTRQYSAHASTRFRATDRWALLAGARATRWQYDYKTQSTKYKTENRHHNVFIPYFGTTFNLTDHLTAYASYTTVFRPQTRYLDINRKPLDPCGGLIVFAPRQIALDFAQSLATSRMQAI